jgi:uncharacterized protein (DUF4213/DUF364 family)
MANPKYIYELLLDHCTCDDVVDNLMIGLVWTLCQTKHKSNIGLAMSPGISTRTLSWSGSLTGKPIMELAAWINDWDPFHAAIGMAAINSCINSRHPPESVIVKPTSEHANLAVFDHFLPQLKYKNVVVIGHYPGIERYQNMMQLSVLERQPKADDLPDCACEFLLPQADWVFLTASSIPNKTFHRLAELASNAKTVLMGPTTPWLPQLHEFGIDYLAGVEVIDRDALFHTAAQGGGVRIFNQGVRYRVAELNPLTSMNWLKSQIASCAQERTRLNSDMDRWYTKGNNQRFPAYNQLEQVNSRLSRLDSSYKDLWDRYSSLARGAS